MLVLVVGVGACAVVGGVVVVGGVDVVYGVLLLYNNETNNHNNDTTNHNNTKNKNNTPTTTIQQQQPRPRSHPTMFLQVFCVRLLSPTEHHPCTNTRACHLGNTYPAGLSSALLAVEQMQATKSCQLLSSRARSKQQEQLNADVGGALRLDPWRGRMRLVFQRGRGRPPPQEWCGRGDIDRASARRA